MNRTRKQPSRKQPSHKKPSHKQPSHKQPSQKPISDEALEEIMKAFVVAQQIPTESVIHALANANGETEEAIRDAYRLEYQEVFGGENDPFSPPGMAVG